MKKENKNLILIDDVNVWDKNPREISSKDFDSLKKKIERWGIWKPFLVWESKKQILGGNSRFKACKELGHKEIWVEYREPKDDAEALEMAIADNESSGEWIKSLLIEQIKLSEDKINLEDYKIVIKDSSLKDFMPIDAEEDSPPDEEDVKSVSVLGDLYELGNHRVLCGDSTSVDNVEKLMDGKKADMVFTDPPYGMSLNTDFSKLNSSLEFTKDKNLKYKSGNRYEKVIGDNEDFTPELINTIFANFNYCNEIFIWGADYIADLLPNRNDGAWIVWDKRLDESADKMYGSTFELCWSKSRHKRMIARIKWAGIFGTEKEFDKKRVHPTQKPQALINWFFDYYSLKDKKLVTDLYLGSGSTLIACEKTERICYGMELDTHYTDVIVARYIKYMQDNGKLFTIKRNGEEIDYNLFLKDGK